MDEKRANGLCFLCDEKYTFGHQCSKRRQLFLMEVLDDDDQIEVLQEETVVTTNEEEGTDHIMTDSHVSMHALSGIHDYRTMRVTGNVEGKPVHILIDTGSTHNFIDIEAVKRLGCKTVETTPFPVSVADGNKIMSSAIWDISWNFNQLKMEFTVDGKKIALRGMQPSSVKVISKHKMRKVMNKTAQIAMIHSCGRFTTARST
ncbi:hypothetical protein BUALT_Bualt09G0034000 [Buddleja alternifolia]|uniref:Uncharacterized protein n=1 Tax=Buddleja alternifolia TaxID=168488 RepID=A0AAV6X889_9LAMI|nr:hypothetical protein BUALT_Bualt09G0034000 [Buddleja alternifolia]